MSAAPMVRGDVFRLRLPGRSGAGHAQHGTRYAVIIQTDALLPLSTAIVAPTSTAALPATFRPAITIGDTRTRVLLEQLRAVDLRHLTDHAGHLTISEQREVDAALKLVLEL